MVEQGYYNERIVHLEERKKEVTADLITAKLTLKGINKEIEKAYEYMNNQTKTVDIHADKDKYISKLENKLDKKNNEINQLKKDNTQLKHDLQNAKLKISKLTGKL